MSYLRAHPEYIPVIDYVREHPGCTYSDIMRDVDTDIHPGAMILLHRRGYIRKVGRKDSVGRWEV